MKFFIIMYMQWSKDNGSTSSYQTLIIPRLPSFGKMALSQFQLYIEAQTTTQCFVWRNCKNTILIWAAEGTKNCFCTLHMLRIYTGLRKWSGEILFDLHLKKWIFHPEYLDANNIFSHPFIQNIKHKPNTIQELSRQMKIALLKTEIGELCRT